MRLLHIEPVAQLKGFVEKMWVFESNGRAPNEDMKLIVPNGLIKLVVPFRNGLFGRMEGCSHLSRPHEMTLIGICDRPSIVDIADDAPNGTIGVEFSPLGAYRFFEVKQKEMKNLILPLEDILGKIGRDIQEQIANEERTETKITLLQNFLVDLLLEKVNDSVFNFCIQRIKSSHGAVAVKELEKQTGYSSRWLNMKFEERIGLSPKNFSAIMRFQHYYQAWASNSIKPSLQDEFHIHYYDQSHFIKEFKRFTGIPPSKMETVMNDFGNIFYRS